MKRGEIWTVAGGSDYAGKPRPAVIVQDDIFETEDSVTVCPLTTDRGAVSVIRPPLEPSAANGLRLPGAFMTDKITTIPRSKCRTRIGRLDETDQRKLNVAVMLFLGLAGR